SNIVLTVTVNCFLHPAHFHRPFRGLRYRFRVSFKTSRSGSFGAILYASPISPQCGHIGPSGQRIASRYSLALSSSVNWGSKSDPDSLFKGFLTFFLMVGESYQISEGVSSA